MIVVIIFHSFLQQLQGIADNNGPVEFCNSVYNLKKRENGKKVEQNEKLQSMRKSFKKNVISNSR